MESSSAVLVEAHGLCRRFGEKQALQPFELEIPPGSITGLIGPNGSGKTTLLRCLVGLTRPDAGTARIAGAELVGDGVEIRRRITYSPGELSMYGEMRGRDQLAWLLRGRDSDALARATATAEGFGLPLARRVRTYSHGMKRQLLFAAALAPRVRVRILDEITEGLDPEKRGAVLDQLRVAVGEEGAVLLSSHHLGEIDRVCDRLVFMRDGMKLSEETAASVAERSRRMLHLGYRAGAPLAAVERAAQELGGVSTTRESAGLRLTLERDDPRALLAQLMARDDLPAPTSIRYGELSLTELYEELYGVDAC